MFRNFFDGRPRLRFLFCLALIITGFSLAGECESTASSPSASKNIQFEYTGDYIDVRDNTIVTKSSSASTSSTNIKCPFYLDAPGLAGGDNEFRLKDCIQLTVTYRPDSVPSSHITLDLNAHP